MNSHERLWRNYDQFARARGRLIADLLSNWLHLKGSQILDAGCGSGGASWALAQAGADVTAIDLHPQPPALFEGSNIRYLRADLSTWHSEVACDAIVLWDVLEHLSNPAGVLVRLRAALKPGGILLIATPNRLSLFNALSDPHYGLPCVALFRRSMVRRIIANWLHWHRPDKPDFPQLLSLAILDQLLRENGFSWRFIHHTLLASALRNPQGLWNRSCHLRLFQAAQTWKLNHVLDRVISDRIVLRNHWLMPTFFVLAEARQ